jgi:hypothetical protein
MLIALVISLTCSALTWLFFGDQRGLGSSQKNPVASLNESLNEVQRKPLRRVIWENIGKDEKLFAGEAVRTSSNAEAKLKLLKNGATIHLEPDSLVVLEENDKGLSLDFLQGNMMVAGGAGDLTVKTGSGEIKMNSADMSLSRDKSGEVNLEVLKGRAELQQGGQKVSLEKDKTATLSAKGVSVAKDRLQILFPKANDSVLLNLIKGEKATVNWAPLPAGYRVSVDTGKSRSNFTRTGLAEAGGEAGTAAFAAKPGKWFLRLTAEASDPNLPKLAPAIVPFTVEPKSPPALLEPAENAALLRKDAGDPVNFTWTNRHSYQSQVLEVATDPQFKAVKIKQDLPGTATTATGVLPDGFFYWRMTGFLQVKDKQEALSSTALPFGLSSNWEVKPPRLLSPVHQQRLSYVDVQRNSGVNLKWQASPGVRRFHVTVTRQTAAGSQTILDQTGETSLAKVIDPVPGAYLWKVAAIDPKDDSEKISELYEFTIDELPPLEWVETNPDHTFDFSTPTPSLQAAWKALTPAPASYRYRVVADGQPLQDGKWLTTKQTMFDISLPQEGKYQASVEALNTRGQAIAATDVRTFTIRPQPLLPAPKWANGAPDFFKSDAKGNLSFSWETVSGARNYMMILESEEGQVLEQRAVPRNTASLSRLKPGQYQVKLKSVDNNQRSGPVGEAKRITVPNVSDIRAPKIKTMKVK